MDQDAFTAVAVERAKREVLEDIAAGIVPETVGSFSELHDYVDANEYGGLCEDETFRILGDDATPVANRVQNAVDAWIKAGRP